MDLPEDTRGALVVKVASDGPAERAGLRGSDTTVKKEGQEFLIGGDVIVSINGQPVEDMDDLITYLVKETRPGDTVELGLIREGGRRETVKVVLGTRPRPEEMQQQQK
jgi:S1-C subfamily serine protease